jgi:hypothetical protein
MKTITFLSALLIGSMGFSQVNPVDFEPGGIGADWTFVVFVNADNPPLEIVPNESATGANTSATVAKFTARPIGDNPDSRDFAGLFSDNIGTFTLNATNQIVKVKVYKPVISDFGIKFEGQNGNINELKVSNTLINQWEVLTFDFSAFVGTPQGTNINRIVLFPDFANRTQENIIFFDDITFSATLGVEEFQNANFKVYPNPSKNDWTIKSENTVITSVDLIDINGRQVLSSQPNTFEMTIDTSNISQGIYIARISSDKGVETVKLVKQ